MAFSSNYDFFAPFMRVSIVTPDGKSFPLIPGSSPTADAMNTLSKYKYTPSESFPYLASLTIELQLAFIAKVTAVLTPPFAEAIKFLDSPLIEYGENELEVQFGYVMEDGNSVLSDKFRVQLLQPDVSIGMDCTITLIGQGVNHSFSAIAMGSRKNFDNKTAKQIIEEVFAGPDPKNPRPIKIDFDPMMDSPKADAFFFDKIPHKNQGHHSDWFFAWSIVRQFDGWIVERGDKIVIMPKDTKLGEPPRFALQLYDLPAGSSQIGPKSRNLDGVPVYPILSVSSPTKAQYIAGVRGLTLMGVDSSSRKVITEIINDPSLAPNRVGSGKGIEPKPSAGSPGANKQTMGGYDHYPGNPTDALKAQAEAEFNSIGTNMGIKLDVDTIGIPDILPADNVSVSGLGVRYSANYSVFSLVHTLSTSGFTTKLELRSNTNKILASVIDVLGTVNEEDPKPSDSGSKDPKKG